MEILREPVNRKLRHICLPEFLFFLLNCVLVMATNFAEIPDDVLGLIIAQFRTDDRTRFYSFAGSALLPPLDPHHLILLSFNL